MSSFSIKLKNNVIDDFMNYAHIKCSSIDSYSNKFNKDYSVKFLEENRFINDVNNGRRKYRWQFDRWMVLWNTC